MKTKLIKAMGKALNTKVEDKHFGLPYKHSNICWEMHKNYDETMRHYNEVMAWSANKKRLKGDYSDFPDADNIMNYAFNVAVFSKNYQTGINIFKRKSLKMMERVKCGCIEHDEVYIDGEKWHMFWD